MEQTMKQMMEKQTPGIVFVMCDECERYTMLPVNWNNGLFIPAHSECCPKYKAFMQYMIDKLCGKYYIRDTWEYFVYNRYTWGDTDSSDEEE